MTTDCRDTHSYHWRQESSSSVCMAFTCFEEMLCAL